MDILRDKDGFSNIRLIILVFVVLTGIVAALLYFPPIPTRTGEVRTSGDITFTDSRGNPLSGAIELSGAGVSSGVKPNVNFISWTNVPNARIYYNALDTKSVSVNLRISGDSPKGRVMLENYGTEVPGSVNTTVPGFLVKYVEISSSGVNFADAAISIQYTDEEVRGLDESSLVIYRYDSATETWSELPAKIDANNNIVSTTVNSLSIFAVSTRIPEKIEVRDTKRMPVVSDIKTYDEAKNVKKAERNSVLSTADFPQSGELEVDALATKNVAVKLKVNVPSKGEVILDDFGKNNPVSVPLPGRAVKYVEIGASGISFSSADITIRYTDAELNGGNEYDLTIYHWNGASWDAVPTTRDLINKTLTATTTSLSPFGVATNVIYYLENNATIQSVGADRTTNYSASGSTITVIPYKNLLKNGTMGTQANIRYTVPTAGVPYEMFRFYLPFNYSVDTQISANATYRINWRTAASTTDKINISLIVYNPVTGAKTDMGTAGNITTGGATTTAYSNTMNNSQFIVPAGSRLMVRINTTVTATGLSRLYFNDVNSYINVTETNVSGGAGALPNITSWGNNKTNNQNLTFTLNTSEFIKFNATANQTITTWSWFEDDINQLWNNNNITTNFSSGIHTIKVNATNSNGTSNTIIWTVTVYAPPNITSWGNTKTNNASLNLTINTSEVVKFNATANQTITQWNWYKDDVFQTSNTTTNTFNTSWSAAGSYHIDVNATNANGTSNSIRWNITVTAPPGNPPNITSWGNNKTNNLSLSVTINRTELIKFNATANQTITTWNWYKDNVLQTSNTTDSFNTSWDTIGSYHVDVNATNANGTSGTITWNIIVTGPPPPNITSWGNNKTNNASLTFTVNTSEVIKFNATANQTITTWNWYKDNVLQSNNFDNFTTNWGTAGSYHIDVNATNANGTSSTITWSVTVSTPPTPPVSGKILVATNRFVVLDDDRKPAGAKAGPGFALPLQADYTTWNSFSGINTMINATALYIDNNGFPVQGTNITFTFYDPNGTINTTKYATTNSYGLANVSFDLNNFNFYGKWNVNATNGTLTSGNETFIYNWWGCSYNSGQCSVSHSSRPPTGTAAKNSPYLSGRDPTTARTTEHTAAGVNCTFCHQSYDGKPGDTNPPAAGGADPNHLNNLSDVHRNLLCTNCHSSLTVHNTNQIVPSCYNATAGCHGNAAWGRADISNKSTLNSTNVATALSEYSINSTDFNATFHTPNSTVPCIICHGPMHNITKPDESLRFIRNNNTEDSQCKACHTSYNEHNSSNTTSGGVNCTLCHSDDVHDIQVFAQNATYVDLNHDNPNSARGNCTNCHQNGTFFAALEKQPKAGNYTGRDPPQIPVPLNHSTDPYAGALWNGTQSRYWDNTSQKSACYYCHGNTTHSTSALGSVSSVRGTNNLNQALTTSRWCANCHYQTAPNYGGDLFTPQPPEVLNQSGLVPAKSRDGTTFTNHSSYFSSGYNDSVCKGCHDNNLAASATSLNFSHNVAIGSGGAPNCIQCHNLVTGLSGGAPVGINFTAANMSVHNGTNSQNATNWSYVPVIGACWACHDTVGNVSTGHPANYKTPKTCTDCHLANSTYYNQSVKWGLNVTVSEHYYGGDQIVAGNSSSNISSCINCHENISEMILYNNDTDTGSFTGDGVRLVGGNMSFYHYGNNRSDLRIGASANCTYCHQNDSTAFYTAMIDPTYNKSINNHSLRYNSSNPSCTSSQCHNSGWIHNSTLTKPNLTLPNSTFCLNCHGGNSTGSINFTGAITSIKEKHNNTVNCTECHLSSSRDIHPMKYLQPNASYNTINSTAVNCINCHQNLTVYPNLTRTPPKIPSPMRHSDNPSNGTLWNTTGYWTNNTITSCIYCHNDTKHNATALGRPAYWKGNNVVNSSITSTSSWCAGCHYQGYSSYSIMTSTFTTANLPVPPEITGNATYGSYANNSKYYNHALTNYTDAACKVCHGMNLTSNDKITVFVHNNITWGSCTDCHYSFVAMNTTTRPDRYVNATLFNNSPHGNGKLTCQNCHTKGHKNLGARKACEDCHAVQAIPITDRDRHNITRTPSTYIYSGTSVVNITDCTTCHDPTLYSEATTTYGFNKTSDCGYCHTYPDKTYS